MARIKSKIVEPLDTPTGEAEAVAIFQRARWAPEDTTWLPQLAYRYLRTQPGPDEGLDFATEENLKTVASAAKEADPRNCRDRALLIAFARLCGVGGKNAQLAHRMPSPNEPHAAAPTARMGLTEWQEIAKEFRSRGAKFENAIIAGGWPGEYGTGNQLASELALYVRDHPTPFYDRPEIVRLMLVLVDAAGLDLTVVVDDGALVAAGSTRSAPNPTMPLRIPKPIDWQPPPITDARSLLNWMVALGPRALTAFFSVFRACPNDPYLAAMAVGVQDAVERWLMYGTHHWTYFREGGFPLAEACLPYLQFLEAKCAASGTAVEPQLRRSWLWFAWCVYEANPNLWRALADQDKERVLRAANEDLSRLRPFFARARLKTPPPAVSGEGWGHLLPDETRAPWEEFKWEEGHFTTCVMLLYQLGGVWRGMKPLLLAIRSFACPCVARDLRHWTDSVEPVAPGLPDDLAQPPDPWSIVPGSMINLFHHYIEREQGGDPDLTSLRGELALFCLDRLGDRWTPAERAEAERTGRARTDDDMTERSPEWRLCLVRAIASLHINPERKGQRILAKSSRLDPHEDVREAAHAASEQLRRSKGMPENVSPRRAVMSALWWIRQAHLLGLGIQPDADGAQRTRAKELTRTKEMERADKLAMRRKP